MLKRLISGCIISLLFVSFIPNVFAQPTDISGTWAETEIMEWISKGLIKGYDDGTYRPFMPVKRTEFVKMVSNVFDFVDKVDVSFSDVNKDAWYYEYLSKAVAAGAIKGYDDGTFRPDDPISRQEAAVMLSRVFHLKAENQKASEKFSDYNDISEWSRDAISALAEKGYITGRPGGIFAPKDSITRAEALKIIDNIMGELKDKEKTIYSGNYKGNVVINKGNVTLRDTTVEGSLYLADGIGDGEILLDNVTIKGRTVVRGGGPESIVIKDSLLKGGLLIAKKKGNVRIVSQGSTEISETEVFSGAKLEESGKVKNGFNNIKVLGNDVAGQVVRLEGGFGNVSIEAAGAKVELIDGSAAKFSLEPGAKDSGVRINSGIIGEIGINDRATVDIIGGTIEKIAVGDKAKDSGISIAGANIANFTVNAPADITVSSGTVENLETGSKSSGTGINISSSGVVRTLTANAGLNVRGKGTINTVNIKASGVVIEQTPGKTNISSGIIAVIGEKTAGTAGSGGGGGGSGGGGGGSSPRISISTINTQSISVGTYTYVNIVSNPADAVKTASSSNNSVATVLVVGDSVKITGVSVGTATINVTAAKSGYNNGTASFTVNVVGKALAYSSSTFTEATANNGTINPTPVTVTLTGDTFTGANGDNFVAAGKVTVENLPAGLTAVAIRTSDTTLSVTLNGAAGAHTNANDISNLTFTFQDSAFASNSAATVTDYIKTMAIDFMDTPIYTVTFNSNGGSAVAVQNIISGNNVIEPADPTRTGYTFEGWYKNATLTTSWNFGSDTVTSNITLYAKWTANTYTVTLNANGGTGAGLTSYTYGVGATLPVYTKTGHTFGGWYDNAGFSGSAVTEITTTDIGNKTYYAKWVAETYSVTLEADGGTGTVLTEYTYGVGATLPTDYTKDGYTFGGWYEESDFSGIPVTQISATDTGNKTYYAKWLTDAYTVTFDSDGGSAVGTQIVESGALATRPVDPTKVGHTFDNWYSDAERTIVWVFDTDTVTANITLYAKWVAETYSVTLEADGGTGTALTSYTYGVGATLPTDYTKDGYTFGGWYDNAGLSGSAVTAISTTDTGDKTYYAKWNAVSLVYSTTTLVEASENDGSIAGSITISLTGDTFNGTNGQDFISAGKITVQDLPSNLTVSATLDTSLNEITLTLGGNATAHGHVNDTSITVSFTDDAFTVTPAASIPNSEQIIGIDFLNPTPVAPSYAINFGMETIDVDTADEYAEDINFTVNRNNGNGTLSLKPMIGVVSNLYFRTRAVPGVNPAGLVQILPIPTRDPAPEAPDIDYENEKIDSAELAGLEASEDNTFTTLIGAGDIALEGYMGDTLYFRKAADIDSFASHSVSLTIPTRDPAPEAPTINYEAETTNGGIPEGVEYSTNSGFATIEGEGDGVTPVDLTPGIDLYFRYKATTTDFASAAIQLDVKDRPNLGVITATYQGVGAAIQLNGISIVTEDGYEYNQDDGGWTPLTTGATFDFSGDTIFIVRKKATLTDFASEPSEDLDTP